MFAVMQWHRFRTQMLGVESCVTGSLTDSAAVVKLNFTTLSQSMSVVVGGVQAT